MSIWLCGQLLWDGEIQGRSSRNRYCNSPIIKPFYLFIPIYSLTIGSCHLIPHTGYTLAHVVSTKQILATCGTPSHMHWLTCGSCCTVIVRICWLYWSRSGPNMMKSQFLFIYLKATQANKTAWYTLRISKFWSCWLAKNTHFLNK